ncbi:MAG TPA: transcription elongation factor subunit Spt4 [Candidatus Nanoarchaeia archaeon]|nr:transcription elongation factor subunit Spt4 [Candidatus Nanoarchaeia archaeon]
MAKKEKACKICNAIFVEGKACPKCDSKEYTETFKGKVEILNPEESAIAQKLNIKDKGEFAIKTR